MYETSTGDEFANAPKFFIESFKQNCFVDQLYDSRASTNLVIS